MGMTFESTFGTCSIRAAIAAVLLASTASVVSAEMLDVEKDELKLGFIKLTDMAPLAIAYEKGFFEEEGLFVTLEPQANWMARICWPASRSRRRSVTAPRRIS